MIEDDYNQINTYTWEDIHKACDNLYDKIKHKKYDAILAVSRGGLIPAAILAYNLNIKKVTTIAVRTYDEDRVKLLDFSILSQPDFDIMNGKVLVVDDLIETGETIKIIKDLDWKTNNIELDFVVLYSKGFNADINYYGEEVDSFNWISFPWDN